MRVLFFGTYDVTRHPRVETLMAGLRAHGDDVVECNVPIGYSADERERLLRRPWLLAGFAFRVAQAWWRLWRRARRLGPFDAVVVGYLGHLDVHLARRLWPRTPVVLDYLVSLSDTADDRDAGAGPVRAALRAVDRAATRTSDVVVVDTDAQRVTVHAAPRRAVVTVPVGVPEWWLRPPAPSAQGPLRVVFYGLYQPLQGAPVIGHALAALAGEAGIVATMVGSGPDLPAARAAAAGNPRVEWRGLVAPRELPGLVAAHDVCLGIFGTGAKALRVVPNKAYQGAAAGCAVVTSDTPPQRSALGDAAVYVPPGDADALAAALRDLAADPARVTALRQRAYDRAAAAFTPRQVVTPLRETLL